MGLKKWEDMPAFMQCDEIRPYYNKLAKKSVSLYLKRVFDVVMATLLLIPSLPVMAVLAVMIKLDSKGPVFFRQVRITQYGRRFKIFKFRTMVKDAAKLGSQVTVGQDARITKVGAKIRKYRIDELPQLFNILLGDMSFVGTRPEVEKYVKAYSKEMRATLLLPAGVTSKASILYKDEERLLDASLDVDKTYIEEVLPAKMEYNLDSIRKYSFTGELKVMFQTVFAVMK